MVREPAPEIGEHAPVVAVGLRGGDGLLRAHRGAGAQIVHREARPGRERDGEGLVHIGVPFGVPQGLFGLLRGHVTDKDAVNIHLGEVAAVHAQRIAPDGGAAEEQHRKAQHQHEL